jgi:hypothetical protein
VKRVIIPLLLLCQKIWVGIDVENAGGEWIDFEASIIENYGKVIQFTGKL